MNKEISNFFIRVLVFGIPFAFATTIISDIGKYNIYINFLIMFLIFGFGMAFINLLIDKFNNKNM